MRKSAIFLLVLFFSAMYAKAKVIIIPYEGLVVAVTIGGATLKKTGQTKSYDENGSEVTDASLKDDGFYQVGVTPRYIRDDASEIVTDHIAALMWQDDDASKTVTKQWLTDANYHDCFYYDYDACIDTRGDTAVSYCEGLDVGGYEDWRLPTAKELQSIFDYENGIIDNAIDINFQNIGFSDSYGSYWTITPVHDSRIRAWTALFKRGEVVHGIKDDYKNIRCVRNKN